MYNPSWQYMDIIGSTMTSLDVTGMMVYERGIIPKSPFQLFSGWWIVAIRPTLITQGFSSHTMNLCQVLAIAIHFCKVIALHHRTTYLSRPIKLTELMATSITPTACRFKPQHFSPTAGGPIGTFSARGHRVQERRWSLWHGGKGYSLDSRDL
jgi:hypothetical protein